MKLFVGSLPWSINDQSLEELFAKFGQVHSAKVIIDRESGRSKGFGFVEMSDEDAKKAIDALNGSELQSRTIVVNQAEDKKR